MSYEITDETILVTVCGLTTGHPELDELVRTGNASWQLRIQCSRTYMRETLLTNEESLQFRLRGPDYEGLVDIGISLVSKIEIANYQPAHIHTDYLGEHFHVYAGEVLGIGPSFRFHVDKTYDPLKAPVSSLIRIMEGDQKDGAFSLTLDDDLIIVRLSKSDWTEYAGIRDRVPSIVHSAIVLPALTEAIRSLNEHTDTLWGGRLKEILENNGVDQNAPLAAAQQILSHPIARTFNEVNTTLDRGET